ncbi:MAG: DUF4157 domain-containing protein [Desulfacinum sp.]|nr:DUF4157 domain-containing protein [Desulfacinum sp.]
MEHELGADLSGVRIHENAASGVLSRSLRAKAFTWGTDIFFRQGAYNPRSVEGRHLIAHELVHTLQQEEAPKAPLAMGSGVAVSSSDDPMEIQAEQIANSLNPLFRAPSPRPASEAKVLRTNTSLRQFQRKLLQRSPDEAHTLVSRHTSWWGNLNEVALGREVLNLALAGQLNVADEVFNALGSTDRDDVAYELVLAATETQLAHLAESMTSRRFLQRLFDELTSGSVSAEEQQQADRILQATARETVSVSEFEAARWSPRTKIFPFRLPGFTVLHDAPIEARRVRGGVWARSVVRVLGTDEFRAETATLPVEYFIGGIILPETEVIGVRLYDQGGIVHYTTPLFLIQLANATNQQVLEKILEAAGIGLTLGTGALAGLGVEASMAARVLLWADRAAFALGTVTSVLREHRGWVIEHFGSEFMDAVDWVHSAAAIYGLARVVLEAPRLIQGLRDSYRTFREAARSRSTGFSRAQQATIQEVIENTDTLMGQIDNIEEARPRSTAAQASSRFSPPAPRPSGASLRVHVVDRLQTAVARQNQRFAEAIRRQDVGFLQNLGLRSGTIRQLLQGEGGTFAAAYGRGLERAVERAIRTDPLLNQFIEHIGTRTGVAVRPPGRPDFRGRPGTEFEGWVIDLTTAAGRRAHYERYYGENMLVLPYERLISR